MLKRILVVDDEKNILLSLKGSLEDEGYRVETAATGAEGLHQLKKFAPDVVLLDIWMPDEDGITVLEKIKKLDTSAEVIMMSGHGNVETAVKAIKLGAFDFLEKPIHFDKVLLLLNHVFEMKELKKENRFLKQELEGETLSSESDSMKRLLKLIDAASPSNGWVLIEGEKGVGKELVARALHHGSARHRFVTLHCPTLIDSNLKETLFGRSAQSGESQLGKIEQADGGTLYLDDVSELSAKAQQEIFRVLEAGSFKKGRRTVEVDIRVIASTHQDLNALAEAGKFDPALCGRLGVIPIRVPPLRQRKEDIPELVEHFLKRYSKGKNKRVSPETLELLMSYPWPGNVRELKNWVERACIFSQSELIESVSVRGVDKGSRDVFCLEEESLRHVREGFEKNFIRHMLSESNGDLEKTAGEIGLERSQLNEKIKNYGIETQNATN